MRSGPPSTLRGSFRPFFWGKLPCSAVLTATVRLRLSDAQKMKTWAMMSVATPRIGLLREQRELAVRVHKPVAVGHGCCPARRERILYFGAGSVAAKATTRLKNADNCCRIFACIGADVSAGTYSG